MHTWFIREVPSTPTHPFKILLREPFWATYYVPGTVLITLFFSPLTLSATLGASFILFCGWEYWHLESWSALSKVTSIKELELTLPGSKPALFLLPHAASLVTLHLSYVPFNTYPQRNILAMILLTLDLKSQKECQPGHCLLMHI